MCTEEFSIITISLLKRCEDSFLSILDKAKVPHGRVDTFGHFSPQASVTEVISMPTHSMPWGVISAVIFTWLKKNPNREVLITTEDGQKTPASTCNAVSLKEALLKAVGISVMETPPKTAPRANRTALSRHVWH